MAGEAAEFFNRFAMPPQSDSVAPCQLYTDQQVGSAISTCIGGQLHRSCSVPVRPWIPTGVVMCCQHGKSRSLWLPRRTLCLIGVVRELKRASPQTLGVTMIEVLTRTRESVVAHRSFTSFFHFALETVKVVFWHRPQRRTVAWSAVFPSKSQVL